MSERVSECLSVCACVCVWEGGVFAFVFCFVAFAFASTLVRFHPRFLFPPVLALVAAAVQPDERVPVRGA